MLRACYELLVKVSAGLQSSRGMTGVRGSPSEMTPSCGSQEQEGRVLLFSFLRHERPKEIATHQSGVEGRFR